MFSEVVIWTCRSDVGYNKGGLLRLSFLYILIYIFMSICVGAKMPTFTIRACVHSLWIRLPGVVISSSRAANAS